MCSPLAQSQAHARTGLLTWLTVSEQEVAEPWLRLHAVPVLACVAFGQGWPNSHLLPCFYGVHAVCTSNSTGNTVARACHTWIWPTLHPGGRLSEGWRSLGVD